MENRIDATLLEESKKQILDEIVAIKVQMPFLIKVSESEKRALQQMDDGRKPFTEKACEFATRNAVINPGDMILQNASNDLSLYASLSSIENELEQTIEMVRDTKQLAGAEAYEVARFIYMKAKMALKMKEPGMQAVVDELGKLYKMTSTSTPKADTEK